MSKVNTNKKKTVKRYLPILVFILLLLVIGFLTGVFIAEYMDSFMQTGRSTGEILLSIGSILIALYLAIILQVILHEAGHLLFGWMTGYRFSSFRIGSMMWVKQDETIKFRKLSIAGTGGQCLMIPPDMEDGKIPFVLYNLGGAIINFLTAAIFAWLSFLYSNTWFLSVLFILIAVVGLILALMNGIPMQLAAVNNDGYNALSFGKNPEAMRSFWIQMKVSEQITKGIRVKDMPEEWFTMPSPKCMKNGIVSVIGVFACNRMMDAMELEKADETMAKLLQMDTGIVGLHRNLLIVDRIYCELVNENRQECLDKMLNKQQKKFMKYMKDFPSVLRTEYAYALLSEKDKAEADGIKAAFKKIAEKYPYPQEIESERGLMAYAEEIYNNSLAIK